MSYASVDGNINSWALSNSLRLFREWDGKENRYTHLTNSHQQTMQIIINQPQEGEVTIHVRVIEGCADIGFSASFTTSVENIDSALVAAAELARCGISINR